MTEKLLAPFMMAAWIYRHWWNAWGAWTMVIGSSFTQPPPCDERKWK